jgi:hypothetical protein
VRKGDKNGFSDLTGGVRTSMKEGRGGGMRRVEKVDVVSYSAVT